MKTIHIFLALVIVFVLADCAHAYNCIFSGSDNYPASNKAYCFASGKNICSYPYGTYLIPNCLSDCCEQLTPGFDSEEVTCGDSAAGYSEYDSLDGKCDSFYSQEVANGNAIKMGFNTFCYFRDNALPQAGDEQKLDACAVECAKGYLTQVAKQSWLSAQERCDSVPPSLRTCLDEREKQLYGAGFACTWGSGTNTQPPPVQQPTTQTGPCNGVVCEKKCELKNGKSVLSYDGICTETGSTYRCTYSEKECAWGCSANKDSCITVSPVQVNIMSPTEGASIDTGSSGVAFINVSGSVTNGQQYGVEEVLVNSGLDYPQPATYNKATGQFTYSNIRIGQGKPVRITATASADNRGKTLGSDSVLVYPAPQLQYLQYKCGAGVTFFKNGQPVECNQNSLSMQEGDTLQLSSSGVIWLTYTDGTIVILKAPSSVRMWNKAIYVDYGAIEVEVNHDYEVLSRQGHHVVRGTHFKVIVPQDTTQAESIIVMEGTVSSALADAEDTSVYVSKGQMLTLVPGSPPTTGDVVSASTSDLVYYFGEMPPSGVSASNGNNGNGSDSGCCASAFVIVFLTVGVLITSRN